VNRKARFHLLKPNSLRKMVWPETEKIL
jgi:hypothetical protein